MRTLWCDAKDKLFEAKCLARPVLLLTTPPCRCGRLQFIVLPAAPRDDGEDMPGALWQMPSYTYPGSIAVWLVTDASYSIGLHAGLWPATSHWDKRVPSMVGAALLRCCAVLLSCTGD